MQNLAMIMFYLNLISLEIILHKFILTIISTSITILKDSLNITLLILKL